jgi:hypothetical protein
MDKVNQIIDQSINSKLEQLIEELTTNEFVVEVGDKIFVNTGKNLDDNEVKMMIGERLTPILINFHQLVLKP